ncbi:nitroreductase family deazaflavin-dependent oxidoreductase [Nocardia speluncae]|uniref:Nitroreductase family deazaflavin-dependent oxidoreductase n=1 Tax=Nocardia speluncae TaxID=419477 RepID=A0A846XCC1_9NOCA|nr:nitroreductase/quinone reductase family protein [Nocardia speluncae]NKY33991.1 nitroreductase family deazaflavin-dependent oxidoreductase [Nocardia speluncae]
MTEAARPTGTTPSAETARYDDPGAPWNRDSADDPAVWDTDVIREFRANGGRVGGAYADATLLLLTTTGAKTGRRHVVPLTALYRGETLYVSSLVDNGGPAWYHNVRADPAVIVELGDYVHHATARVLSGAVYDEFAAWVLANNPLLADFQTSTERPIPLVILTLAGSR